MKRSIRFGLLFGFAFLASCVSARCETVDGFVTSLNSPNDFYLGALHVAVAPRATCSTERFKYQVTTKPKSRYLLFATFHFALREHPVPASMTPAPCDSLNLHLGSRVSLVGQGGAPGDFTANSIVVWLVQDQIANFRKSPEKLEGGAIIEEPPDVHRTAQGWAGHLWLDGYPLSLSSQIALLTAPAETDIVFDFSGWAGLPRYFATPKPPSSAQPVSADLFRVNSSVIYHALRTPNDRISATRLRLWPNEISDGETKYRKAATVIVQPPSYQPAIAGKVSFQYRKSLEILPDQAVQDWVSSLGNELVPPYQRSLPKSDPTKIDFRFYVVRGSQSALTDASISVGGLRFRERPTIEDAAIAMPDGLVFIPDSTLSRIRNSAQMAAILSYAITTVLQKHAYLTSRSLRNSGAVGDWTPYYAFAILKDEQALRIGIRQMYLAGYDIREAPFGWALAAGKTVANPLIDPAPPNNQIPWYTTYAFNYISQFYSDVDYSKLKRGEREYAQFLDELRKADPEAFDNK
jgi:hypothetical protein